MGLAGVLVVMTAVVIGGCGAWGLLLWVLGRAKSSRLPEGRG